MARRSAWEIVALLVGTTPLAYSNGTLPVVADYMLHCQGCHLPRGEGFPARGVPRLTNYAGNFLKVPGGRDYLVQVPGAAQSELSDERLASLLNWMLADFSAAQLPRQFQPYSAAEVRRLRQQPLVDVSNARIELVRRIERMTK